MATSKSLRLQELTAEPMRPAGSLGHLSISPELRVDGIDTSPR
jgi:hypothetical protein